MPIPHFVIKNRFQKRAELYQDILTPEILGDVCQRVTGRPDYTFEFDNTGYNKGRLATIEYNGSITYVSFSESEIKGRNSAIQSFPTALVKFHLEENPDKRICYYFLPLIGKYQTDYFIFMYRLMKTANTEFINEADYLTVDITPFTDVADIVAQRYLNREKNRANNSTFLTRSPDNKLQIFGKTYGANKYETTLLCIALSEITPDQIDLYQICEQELSILPVNSLEVIDALGKINVIATNITMEQKEFEENDSLRSPEYTYNLLLKLGDKKCALCECEIPQLIQGAHIWPVASIKRKQDLSQDQKLQYALDGENGIWLCQNHHKLLDSHFLRINEQGVIEYTSDVDENDEQYIIDVTKNYELSDELLTPEFKFYLDLRNELLNDAHYDPLENIPAIGE